MNPDRILIIEDEPALLRGLTDTFQSRKWDVLTASDGEAGLDLALSGNPDLVLLDIMLPRVNGYEVCRAIRQQGGDMPILMLTAKGREADVILGLNLGADDYITKPFRLGELLARVNAFLRKRKATRAAVVRFGAYELDLTAQQLTRDGRPVELTAKERQLLVYFANRHGCALARNDILNAVWGRSVFVTPRSVDRCVATLRSKIESDLRTPEFIHTIRDIGYRFELGAAAEQSG